MSSEAQLQSIISENNKLQYEVGTFKPKGFFGLLRKIFLGIDSFKEIKELKQKIEQNHQTILNIETGSFLNKVSMLEKSFIQKRVLPGIKQDAEDLHRRQTNFPKESSSSDSRNRDKVKYLAKSNENWRENANKIFIEKEKSAFDHYFDTVESNPLTQMQKAAVITNEENNLILAGAGSGKTSVIVAKVGYILKKQLAKSNEILILAFNKKAQEELSKRISKKLNISVDTKTFHSLGLAIISEANGVKPSLCKWVEDENKLIELIRKIIHEKLKNDEKFYESFKRYFVSHFAPYKGHEDFENLGEYYEYIQNYSITTFQGEKVKSFEECEVANLLFMWGIAYRYEDPYKYETGTQQYRQYVPDFYLPEYDVYIEHFGISRDGSTALYIDAKKYNEDREWKIALHKKNRTSLVQTFSYEKSEGVLKKSLKRNCLNWELKRKRSLFRKH